MHKPDMTNEPLIAHVTIMATLLFSVIDRFAPWVIWLINDKTVLNALQEISLIFGIGMGVWAAIKNRNKKK